MAIKDSSAPGQDELDTRTQIVQSAHKPNTIEYHLPGSPTMQLSSILSLALVGASFASAVPQKQPETVTYLPCTGVKIFRCCAEFGASTGAGTAVGLRCKTISALSVRHARGIPSMLISAFFHRPDGRADEYLSDIVVRIMLYFCGTYIPNRCMIDVSINRERFFPSMCPHDRVLLSCPI